ncbi:hypothetical protein D1P53_006093 [Cryptococcus gattii VGV]|nr:hypothetical protein D1P53_006093 [Cryptococcus gattii VGV]
MTRNCDAVRSFITAVHEAQTQHLYKDLLQGQSSSPGERGARGITGPAGSQDPRTPSGPPAPLGITKEEILVLFKEFKQEVKTMLDDSHAALKMELENLRKEIKKAPSIQKALRYNSSSITTFGIYNAKFLPVPSTIDERDSPDGLARTHQWYEYYHGEVPEGGPFGEAGAVLTDRQLREAILSKLIPYVLWSRVLSD